MGNFYTNFIVFGAAQDATLTILRELRREGYVTPSICGGVTVYDADSDRQDTDAIERLGADLSERLQLPVMAVLNHDDDHLLLWLFRGRALSRYSSILHGVGFAASLSRVRGGILAFPLVAAVLTWPVVFFQSLRH